MKVPGLTHKHQTRLENVASDKLSSLLRKFINYGPKKFYNTGPRIEAMILQVNHMFGKPLMK